MLFFPFVSISIALDGHKTTHAPQNVHLCRAKSAALRLTSLPSLLTGDLIVRAVRTEPHALWQFVLAPAAFNAAALCGLSLQSLKFAVSVRHGHLFPRHGSRNARARS